MKMFLPAVLFLSLLFTGCGSGNAPVYNPADFICTLSIDSVSTGEAGYFQGQFVTAGGTASLTVTAPERLAGLTFTFTESGCVMDACGVTVPLSEDTAASLTDLVRLLRSAPEDAVNRNKTAAGTVLIHRQGQLTLNDAGYPVLAETTDGRRAQITFPPAAEQNPPPTE